MPDATHFSLFFGAAILLAITPGHVFLQFIFLGGISVVLNTSADLIVATFAGAISEKLKRNPRLQKRQRVASGFGMIGLGMYIGFSGTGHAR